MYSEQEQCSGSVLYMGKKTEFDNLMETDKSSRRMLKSTFAIRSG